MYLVEYLFEKSQYRLTDQDIAAFQVQKERITFFTFSHVLDMLLYPNNPYLFPTQIVWFFYAHTSTLAKTYCKASIVRKGVKKVRVPPATPEYNQAIKEVMPAVQHSLRETPISLNHAVTEAALIAYMIGRGYSYRQAIWIVESWEQHEIFPM